MASILRVAGFCLSAMVLLICLPSAAEAQKRPAVAPQYSKWLNEEVNYIITDEEKKDFQRLTADTDRDRFIEDFWAARNPVPVAAQNTFKEEHYKRLLQNFFSEQIIN